MSLASILDRLEWHLPICRPLSQSTPSAARFNVNVEVINIDIETDSFGLEDLGFSLPAERFLSEDKA